MKIICSQQELSKAVNTVQKAVTNRTTIPILKGILLEVENEHTLKLAASDLDLSIEKKIEVEVKEKGSIVVSARLFSDIIKKLPSGEVSIEIEEQNVIIKTIHSEFSIVGQSVNEFPSIREFDSSNYLNLNKELFKNMIKQVAFSASIDESRGIIVGVLIEMLKDQLNIVALDGFRMAVRKEKIKSLEEKNIIIPAKTLNEIYKILVDENCEDILINLDEKDIIINIDNTIVVSKLLEGEYINYKEIIPKNYATRVRVSREELFNSIERASLLAREGKNNLIKLTIEDNTLIINSRSEEGKVHEEIEITKEGENLEIGFNSKYIIDVLRALEEDEIMLEFTSNVSPCLIKPVKDEEFLYLILPVRIAIN